MIWALRALDNWVGGTEEEKFSVSRGEQRYVLFITLLGSSVKYERTFIT